MVDLPKVPRRLVTSEAPRSRVSGEVVGAPMQMLGNALGTLGEGVEATGVRIAEDEGRRAVTIGEDGTPKFEPMPAFTGRAGEAYNRVGLNKWAVLMQNKTEDEVLQKRLELRGDPEKFDEWGRAYIEKLAANEPDEKLRDIVKAQATNQVQQHYRALSAEKQNLDIQSAGDALKQRQVLTDNRLLSLRQSGTPPESPEYQALLADRAAIRNERIRNPLYRYSQEQAAIEDQQFETQSVAVGLVGAVRRTAASNATDAEGKPVGGIRKAQELADSILTDPRLADLTIEQRHHYHRLAVAETKALAGENQLLVNNLNAEAQQLRKVIEKGDIDPETVRDFLQRASEAKAVRGWTAVTKAVSLQEQLRGWFDRLPPEERNRVQLQLEGKLGNLADRIIRAESGNDPFARATTSSAVGAGQFIEQTWLTLVTRHRPAIAATATREELLAMRNDPELSRELVMRNTEESRDILARAGLRTDDAALYLTHFLGAGNAAKVLKAHSTQPLTEVLPAAVIAANQPIFKNVKTVGELSAWASKKIGVPEIPASVKGDAAFLVGVLTRRKQELDTAFPNIEKRIRQGETISDDELEQFGALVFSVGTPEQRQKSVELAVMIRAGAAYTAMSAQERSNATLEFSRMFASGSARLESEVGQFTRQLNQTITTAYKDDPYDAAVRYGKRAPVPALDFENPQAVAAALQARVKEQEWVKLQQGTGPFSLLRPAEAETLRARLTHGDAAAAAATLTAITAAGNEEAVIATLASAPMKAALSGMILTGDSGRMQAAFSTLDRLWRTNPQQFEATFGEDIYKKLTVWQANLSYRKPEEIADLLRKAEDPQFKTVREKLLKDYTEEANKISDRDLLGNFSQKILGVTISAAQPATTPIQMGVFRKEFAGIYASLRADGVDQTTATDRAVKWASQAWGVSAANGNRLMRRPPEHYLPTIDGSHDWVHQEVRSEIERVLGPQFSGVAGGLRRTNGTTYVDRIADLPTLLNVPRVGVTQNWDYALVADPQTEGEIARFNQWKAANPGKTPPLALSPSYILMVFDKDKREINLWDRGAENLAEQGPFNIGSAAALQRQTVRVPRFRWSDTAMSRAEAQFGPDRQEAFDRQQRADAAYSLFPTVLTAGAVPIRPMEQR